MSSTKTFRDLTAPTRDGVGIPFDLHVPAASSGPLPLVIYLHGGGWLRGSRVDAEAVRQLPVVESGVALASIDYRLSGEGTWPMQLEDVEDAIAAVPAIAAEQGVELSGRIAVWGASAGGHLAIMTALAAAERGERGPDAVAAWFPVTDLTLMSNAPKSPTARLPHFMPPGAVPPAFERLLLGLEDGVDGTEALRAASPLYRAAAGVAPILLVHGDEDALVPHHHSLVLRDALVEKGADVTLLIVRDATHEDPALDTPAILGATAAHLRGRP